MATSLTHLPADAKPADREHRHWVHGLLVGRSVDDCVERVKRHGTRRGVDGAADQNPDRRVVDVLGPQGAWGRVALSGIWLALATALWQFAKVRLARSAKFLGGLVLLAGLIRGISS